MTTKVCRLTKTKTAAAALAITVLAAQPAFAGPGHGKNADDHAGGTTQQQGGGHMMGGHGGGHHNDPKGPHDLTGGHHGFAFGTKGKASEVTRTITVTMRDNYYEPETISVKAGETVRIKVANKGEFLHEFGLGTAAMHAKHQKQMMTMMEHGMIEPQRINFDRMKMDHGGGGMMAHDDPNSILLEPGKSGEIVWKFTKPMKLEFACNIPGHYESGMMGEVRFQ